MQKRIISLNLSSYNIPKWRTSRTFLKCKILLNLICMTYPCLFGGKIMPSKPWRCRAFAILSFSFAHGFLLKKKISSAPCQLPGILVSTGYAKFINSSTHWLSFSDFNKNEHTNMDVLCHNIVIKHHSFTKFILLQTFLQAQIWNIKVTCYLKYLKSH